MFSYYTLHCFALALLGSSFTHCLILTLSTSSSPPRQLPTHRKSHKHRFLQVPDWAAVSVSRPLDIKFAPAEEFERFGKRRKLNDADRKRLSVAAGSTIPGLLQSRRRARELSATSSLDRIQIHIDGQPAGLHSTVGPELMPSSHSSSSMLLGHSTPVALNPSFNAHQQINHQGQDPWRKFGDFGPSLDPSANIPRAPSTIPETMVLQETSFVTPPRIATRSIVSRDLNSHRRIRLDRHGRHTDFTPAPTDSNRPRHFIIDDQVLAEQNGLGIHSDIDRRAISRSPSLVSTLLASPTMMEAPVSSKHNVPSRLSQPHIVNTRITDHQFHSTDSGGLLKGVRVFGQLVRLNTQNGTMHT